ncbi:MAG: SagB/ThcOx family dehydrogenase [Bacillota bacterium]
MNRRTFLKTVPAFTLLAAAASSFGQETPAAPSPTPDLQPIPLPKPEMDGGKSVLAALKERRTNRNISDKKLSPQMLSNLLWAAWGINREGGPSGRVGRTAASASNSQEIDLYVVLAEGVYLYEAVGHRLLPVAAGDHRAKAGRGQGGAMAKAPVNLVFVADIAKFSNGRPQEPGLKDPEIQKSYYNIATGLIAANVYLFAASQGLAAWFHNCNKPALTTTLKLRPDQHVLYAQTVGYPA